MSAASTRLDMPVPALYPMGFLCSVAFFYGALAGAHGPWPYVGAVVVGITCMCAFTHGWLLRRRWRMTTKRQALFKIAPAYLVLLPLSLVPKAHNTAMAMMTLIMAFSISHWIGPWWDAALNAPQLVLPPGARARAILGWVVSPRTMDRVFLPVLADMQTEWLEAMVAGRAAHARWIRVRGYWDLAQHAVAQAQVSLARAVYEVWKASKPGGL